MEGLVVRKTKQQFRSGSVQCWVPTNCQLSKAEVVLCFPGGLRQFVGWISIRAPSLCCWGSAGGSLEQYGSVVECSLWPCCLPVEVKIVASICNISCLGCLNITSTQKPVSLRKKSKSLACCKLSLSYKKASCLVAADNVICRKITILHYECVLIQVSCIYTVLKAGITRMWRWCFSARPR